MTRSQAVAAGLLAGQAMCGYALVQPDFVLPPLAKFVVGVVNVGLGAVLLFLRIQPSPPVIQVPGGEKQVGG
jgi:hypothetical protein